MKKNIIITQKEVRRLFDYREDGTLIRKHKSPRGISWKGQLAGSLGNCGYHRTYIKGKIFLNHQIVWLWHYGYIPENEIDHIDRDKTNNRIENLREVSRSCNAKNLTILASNTSGVTGVGWYKRQSMWESHISVKGRKIHIGRDKDYVEAVAMRLAAEQYLEWSPCNVTSPAAQYIKNYLQGVRL